MNNIMDFLKSNISFIYESVPYILSFSIGSLLGWKLNNRTEDREFLRSKIYSPLYEEIKLMGENISDFEDCYTARLGQTSNPSTVHVRNSLLKAGQYKLIPKKLRKDIDSYYESCEDYNKQLSNAYEEVYKIFTGEIRKIKTEENHKKFLHDNEKKKWRYDEVRKKRISNTYGYILNIKFLINGVLLNPVPDLNDRCNHLTISSYKSEWDNTINTDDLDRNSLFLKDFLEKLIGLVSQRTTIIKLRDLQNQLKNPENLLKKIEKRIHNPNPLVERLNI